MFEEKSIPRDLDAEEATLGSILIDSEAMDAVSPFLKIGDFFTEQNQLVYKSMLQLYNRGEAIDQITVSQELNSMGKYDEAGGAAYLSHLISIIPTSLHAVHYARIVKNTSIRRRLISCAGQIESLAYNEQDPQICMSKTDQMLLKIQSEMAIPHLITPEQLAELAFAHYDELRNPQHHVSLSTGFEDLDYHTGGFFAGDLTIFAARTGLGKSQVALQIAQVVGKIAPVLLCPIEMHYKQTLDRLTAQQIGVPIRQIRAGGYSEELADRIFGEVLPSIHNSGIYLLSLHNDIVDTPTITVNMISTMARHMKLAYGLGLIIIDYIGLIDPLTEQLRTSRAEQVGYISRRLKLMSNSLEIPTLAIAQINREPERRADKRPELSDLRDSGNLEQDADNVWFLYRDDYYDSDADTKGTAEFIIAKQRQGQSNIKLKLTWNEQYGKYNEIGIYGLDK